MAEISDALLIARPHPGGWTWTLASWLGDLLFQAESQFGERDRSFTVVGTEFREGVPQIWFPGNRNHVVVQLSTVCLQNPHQAVFQLAHECVHLLNPRVQGTATLLEEGVATVFSVQQTQRLFGYRFGIGDSAYECAADTVEPLLQAVPDGVRQLRSRCGSISSASPTHLMDIWPALSVDAASELCKPFGPERNVA